MCTRSWEADGEAYFARAIGIAEIGRHGKPQRRLIALFVEQAQPMCVVIVLGDDVAVVMSGARTAAAAALRVVAGTATRPAYACALLEHGARAPDLVGAARPRRFGFLGHVGAGALLIPLAADDAVREGRQAAALKRVSMLPAASSRVNWGAHGSASMGTCDAFVCDVVQQLLVLQHLERRLLDELAAAGDEARTRSGYIAPISTAKSVMAHTSSRFQSTTVVCSWKAGQPACRPDARHGEVVGVLEPAELVVLVAASRLSTGDAHGAGPGLLQPGRRLERDERAVRAETGAQPARERRAHQLVDVRSTPGGSPPEEDHLEARAGDLVDHLRPRRSRAPRRAGLLGILVAMDALRVATCFVVITTFSAREAYRSFRRTDRGRGRR